MGFHEVRFPTSIARGVRGGPERRTTIVALGSGAERRNARWADSRRRYEAGFGVRTLPQLMEVVAFFEARRGRLHGFRFRDPLDHASGPPGRPPLATDQTLGLGDGVRTAFPLAKTYGAGEAAWTRRIAKPVVDSVLVAVGGEAKLAGTAFDLEPTTGLVSFRAGHTPPPGAVVTAGFLFDTPVRFDADRLEIDVSGFEAGAIPSIPLVEIRV